MQRDPANNRAKSDSSAPPADIEYTLYCDESGNTGLNYLDETQPVHVAAGWLVPRASDDAWAAAITKIREQHGGDELHAVKLMKSRQGLEIAAEVLEAARVHGGLPRSLVAFKKHCVAKRIVEIFLDPESNPSASWLPAGADQTRKDLAAALWTVAPDAVRRFAAIFRAPDAGSWGRFANELATEVEGAPLMPSERRSARSRLTDSLRTASEAEVIAEIIHGEQVGDASTGDGKRYEAMSLNFPVFLEFLRQVDPILSRVSGVCDVVHDETPQFQAGFAQGVETFARIGQIDYISEDSTPWRLSPGRVRTFRTADSRSVVGIQAADVLASTVARIARRSCDRIELNDREQVLAALAMSDDVVDLLNGVGSMVPGIGSDDDVCQLHRSILKAFDAVEGRWPVCADVASRAGRRVALYARWRAG